MLKLEGVVVCSLNKTCDIARRCGFFVTFIKFLTSQAHMKCQAYFSLKNINKNRISSTTILNGALTVKVEEND